MTHDLTLAFLCSAERFPGRSKDRRPGFQFDALNAAFAARGWRMSAQVWDDPALDPARFDVCLVGTTWDYPSRPDAFLDALKAMEAAGTRVLNPPALIGWNMRKTYLAELSAKGVPIIDTQWIAAGEALTAGALFAALGPDVVIKQQVGAGAYGQHRLIQGQTSDAMPIPTGRAMMAQPFMPAIVTEGEVSFLFAGDQISHALIKRPKPGDYRSQGQYGAEETALDMGPDAPAQNLQDLAAARHVLDVICRQFPSEPPLYARIDMVRGKDGRLRLMEAELIEPYLYPLQGPRLGDVMADALARRLGDRE
jgi:hypothetical protein